MFVHEEKLGKAGMKANKHRHIQTETFLVWLKWNNKTYKTFPSIMVPSRYRIQGPFRPSSWG